MKWSVDAERHCALELDLYKFSRSVILAVSLFYAYSE